MPWDRTRTGAVSSSRGPARWRARGAGAAKAGSAGEAGEGSARRRSAQTAVGGGAEVAGSGAVPPGAYGRGGRGRLSALLPCRAVRERRSAAVGRSEKVVLAYHWEPVVVSFARDVASFRRSAAGWGGGEA